MEITASKTLVKTKKALNALEATCSNFSEDNLPCHETLEETYCCLVQNQELFKKEFLETSSRQLLLNELWKDPHQWLSLSQSDIELEAALKTMREKKLFLKSLDDKLEETIQIALEALSTTKTKMTIISNKKSQLENKYCKLKLLPKVSNVEHIRQMKRATDRVYKLIENAEKAQNVLGNRLHEQEKILQTFLRQSAKRQIIKNETAKRQKNLQQIMSELERCSGFSCYNKADNSVTVEFLASPPVVEKEEELPAMSTDSKLILTMDFSINNQGQWLLTEIQVDQNLELPESLKRMAIESKDLSSFITEVNRIWLHQVTFNSEISRLRKRHAIDWIPENNLLLLMVRHTNIVCSLRVPQTYPSSGKIIMESITGHPSGLTSNDIMPPAKMTLSGWVSHLEKVLGQSLS